MNEDRSEEDPLMDLWYSNWEQQCVEALETEPDYETQLHNEKELYSQQMWTSFQTTASAIAQLYKDRMQGVSLWLPFQTAAGTVTSLYKGLLFGHPFAQPSSTHKHTSTFTNIDNVFACTCASERFAQLTNTEDSMDSMRRCSELGVEMGRQKHCKEIMNWARKKRRMIRREDLLAYLAGKPPPPRSHSHRSSPKPRMMVCSSPSSESSSPNMVVAPTPLPGSDPDPELHTFREAIALSGSPISRRAGRQAELSAFISSEFARHHKRPASHDVDMGSPTHKRSRFM